jgi:hypothetical protein
MLNELSKYENLGTPRVFHALFKLIGENKQSWTPKNLNEYLFNQIIDGQSIFDGCLPFAFLVGAISKANDETISLNSTLQSALSNEKHFNFRLLEIILSVVKDDEVFHEIFNSRTISFDVIYNQIQIDRGAFRFRYANFRHLLLSFSFLQEHPEPSIRKFIIHQRYRKLFDSSLLPEIKRKKIGVEQLEKMLAQKQIHGREAEDYVLVYEKKRLSGHPKIKHVEIISGYDVSAGFDIVSFDSCASQSHDRFIEVKSYAGQPNFHWSRNEMKKAGYMKEQYFLYLVDRTKMKDEDYKPLKIQNPCEHILLREDLWEKRVEDYFITKLPE